MSDALILSAVEATLAAVYGRGRLLLAFSGGLDSTVLLHVLCQHFQAKASVIALHINHGLSVHANQWQDHCVRVCTQWQIPLKCHAVQVMTNTGKSIEAMARHARYQALREQMRPGDLLLTAHHLDDQAETVLLQLARGAGVRGLSAMRSAQLFKPGKLLRPLLTLSRTLLVDYANRHALTWIEDESNQDMRFDRNFLRQQVMPLLQQRWPAFNQRSAQSAAWCHEALELNQVLARNDLPTVLGTQRDTLSVMKLQKLTPQRMRNVLRYWLRQLALPIPPHRRINQIIETLLPAHAEANPQISWQAVSIRRFRDDIYALAPMPKIETTWQYVWDLRTPLTLPGKLGQLQSSQVLGKGISVSRLLGRQVTLRFRQGGELCHPHGRSGRHPLKKLWQEWNIPPWQRDRIPLLYCERDLIAVLGCCICQGYVADAFELGWLIHWERSVS